jgi:hypothetical protein
VIDERSGGGNGRGPGSGRDEPDGFAGPDDETVVIVSDSYTRTALGRLAVGQRAVADLCDWFREGGAAASHAERAAVLGELRERLTETKLHNEGALRAVTRLEHDAIARARLEHDTKGERTK